MLWAEPDVEPALAARQQQRIRVRPTQLRKAARSSSIVSEPSGPCVGGARDEQGIVQWPINMPLQAQARPMIDGRLLGSPESPHVAPSAPPHDNHQGLCPLWGTSSSILSCRRENIFVLQMKVHAHCVVGETLYTRTAFKQSNSGEILGCPNIHRLAALTHPRPPPHLGIFRADLTKVR